MTTPCGPLASWAQAYGALGWPTFPARPGGKAPLFRGWQRDATIDPDRLAQAFDDERRNIATPTGDRFDVFDIEADHLPAVLGAIGGRWPDTPRTRTGRGGVHLFVAPTGADGTRRLVLGGVHVGELKSRGGLVILPPSVTVGQYRWESARSDLPLAAAPPELLALVYDPPRATPAVPIDGLTAGRAAGILAGLLAVVREARQGDRNAVLFWAACRAREHGLPPERADAELAIAAQAAGLHRREIRATLRSAARV